MYMTMRGAALALTEYLPDRNSVRLFSGDRANETIYAITELLPSQTRFSNDILYIARTESIFPERVAAQLPRNLLCTGAAELSRPPGIDGINLILVSADLSVRELSDCITGAADADQHNAHLSGQLLDILGSTDLQAICTKASSILGNPMLILDVNFSIEACELLNTSREDLRQRCVNDNLDTALFELFMEDRKAKSTQFGEALILDVPEKNLRLIHSVVAHDSIPLGFIVLIEERVAFAQEDVHFLTRLSNVLHLVMQYKSVDVNSRLMQEYTLVRQLNDSMPASIPLAARLQSAGYKFRDHMLVICVDSSHIVTANLAKHLNTLAFSVRSIIGNDGLTTIFKDQVISLVALDRPEVPKTIIENLRVFLSKTGGIQAGVSQIFSDSSEIKTRYRQALDVIAVGRVINGGESLYFFDDYRVYKLIVGGPSVRNYTDLAHPRVVALALYDREHGTDYMEALFIYLYSLKNTRETAERLHIHRNTLLYRLDKIKSIMGVDFDDGETVFQLMLSFKILEYEAKSSRGEACFMP